MRRLTGSLLVLLCLPLLAAAGPATKPRQKLYVTNSAGDDITVIDVATNKPVGRIEVGPHPHGIAAPDAQDMVYVTVEGSNPGELVAIDPLTDRVVRRMPVGPAPNQLAVTPDGRLAYVPCGDGSWVVVDLAKFRVVTRVVTGGRPHNTACSADGKYMFLAPMGPVKKVVVVETATHRPVGAIAFSDVVRPIAISHDGLRLYANVDNLIGFEVADVPARKRIARIADELTAAERKVPSRSHGLAIRPDQKELWECDVEHGVVHVFDLTGPRPRQVATVAVGNPVYWLTFRPDGKVCYVSTHGGGDVAAVDTETRQVVARIPVGKDPKRLLVVTPPDRKQ
ncbi:MAG TPA: cytochrome D1 domain-containing protein [Gemmataceae bacterium]|nr:cytochrome D1 domain-containing protein [Gemmataceae bacterium]